MRKRSPSAVHLKSGEHRCPRRNIYFSLICAISMFLVCLLCHYVCFKHEKAADFMYMWTQSSLYKVIVGYGLVQKVCNASCLFVIF